MEDFSASSSDKKKMSDGLNPTTIWQKVLNNKIRVYRTANLYLSCFSLGLVMNLPGVTLPDLQRTVHATTTQMGYVLTFRFIGYCIGSLAGGWLFTKIHRLVLFTIILLLISGLNFAAPFCEQFYLLMAVMVSLSMVLGSMDTGANVLCLDLWMDNPGPFFQGLHFTYGLGSVIGPLIAEPFLSPEDEEQNNSTSVVNSTEMVPTTLIPPVKDIGNVVASYSIISAFVFLVAVSSLVSFLVDRSSIQSNTEKERVSNKTQGKILPRVLIGLGMLFLAGYVGLENVYTQFLTTFVMNSKLKMSKSTGSFMTSTFWGTYCFGRGISVFLATKFNPLHLLFFNLTVISGIGVVLAVFGEESAAVMWAGSAILGFGCASTWASSLSWMERYVGISNYVSALFVVSGSLGGFLIGLVVTQFMDTAPSVYLYVVCVSSVICVVALAGQLRVVWHIKGRRARDLTSSSIEYLDKTEHIN